MACDNDVTLVESRLHLVPRVTPHGMVVYDGLRLITESRGDEMPFLRCEKAGSFREAAEGEVGEYGRVVGPPENFPKTLQTVPRPIMLRVTAI